MKPTKIKQHDPAELSISWDDGHESRISLKRLRDRCPCAGCQGETVLLKTYVPPPVDTMVPGRYNLVGAEIVGSYALKLSWGDGHNLGLYTWEHLRNLCECAVCQARKVNDES